MGGTPLQPQALSFLGGGYIRPTPLCGGSQRIRWLRLTNTLPHVPAIRGGASVSWGGAAFPCVPVGVRRFGGTVVGCLAEPVRPVRHRRTWRTSSLGHGLEIWRSYGEYTLGYGP